MSAVAQGIVRISGVVTPNVYYTALFRRPGSPFLQWRRAVSLTDTTGTYNVSVSDDQFMGTNFTTDPGDELVVLFWQRTDNPSSLGPGNYYEGQDPSNGLGGDHVHGFKHNNGSAGVSNYAGVDRFVAMHFVMNGNSWSATPGGLGTGDINGDVDLIANQGPNAQLPLSTDVNNPTDIQRLVEQTLDNSSADGTASTTIPPNSGSPAERGQFYSRFGQILFQQVSAAHRPSSGPQSPDDSPTDGSRYRFFPGLNYLNAFGDIIAGANGTLDAADQVHYPGPAFVDHDHTWPHIDIYPLRLTVKDDAGTSPTDSLNPPLTDAEDFYVRTTYRPIDLAWGSREWASWDALVAQSGNPAFSPANPNTVRDVVRLAPVVGGPDNTIAGAGTYQAASPSNGIIGISAGAAIPGDPWSSAAIYRLLSSPVDFGPAGQTLVISQANIGAGITPGDLAADEIPGFITFVTQTLTGQPGQPIQHSYRILSATQNSLTVQTDGSSETYSARDWFFISNEPGGGNRVRWEWEVEEGVPLRPYQNVGESYAILTSPALPAGTSISRPGIGEGKWPGMWLHVLNGPQRGWYRVAEVPNDNQIVLAGGGLPGQVSAGDTIAFGFPSKPVVYPQRKNDQLNFRIAYQFTNGWSQTANQPWRLDRNPAPSLLVDTGSVNNIDPEPVIPAPNTLPGLAVTYVFNGRRSYGTQVVWVQGDPLGGDPQLANGGSISPGTSVAFTDPNLDNSGLRDNGHAVLVLANSAAEITRVFRIVDIDHTNPNTVYIDSSSLSSLFTYSSGQGFRTANDYEVEPGGNPNDIASYAWELRSSTDPLPAGGVSDSLFPNWWGQARSDGLGGDDTFQHTYPQADDGRTAVVALTVTDEDTTPGGNPGASDTKYLPFVVDVSGTPGPGVAGPRRIEWD